MRMRKFRYPVDTDQFQKISIEHIFGFIEGAMDGSLVRSIGMVRAKAANALTNLVYNIFRYVQIVNFHPQFITCKG